MISSIINDKICACIHSSLRLPNKIDLSDNYITMLGVHLAPHQYLASQWPIILALLFLEQFIYWTFIASKCSLLIFELKFRPSRRTNRVLNLRVSNDNSLSFAGVQLTSIITLTVSTSPFFTAKCKHVSSIKSRMVGTAPFSSKYFTALCCLLRLAITNAVPQ